MYVIRYKHPEEWIWEVVKTTPLGRVGLGLKRHSNNSHKVGHMCQGFMFSVLVVMTDFWTFIQMFMSINASQMLYQICLSCLCIHELKSKGYHQAKQKISSIKII